MRFFKMIDSAFSSHKVLKFPDAGIEFLENNKPKNPFFLPFYQKLVLFIKNLIVSKEDIEVRQILIDEIVQKIQSQYQTDSNDIIILPCGSSMNGTFLSNSDIDLALLSYPMPSSPDMMDELKVSLQDLLLPQGNYQPIPTAGVPVLKFDIKPGISIDLTFDDIHGPLSVSPINDIFKQMPFICPAQLFFKFILREKDLEKPFTGGISSYTLLMMLVGYVQQTGPPHDIVDLILGFCKFFGKDFNYSLTGIDIRNSGILFSRIEKNMLSLESPSTMCIIDPLNPKNILGHNSFNMPKIQMIFYQIYQAIEHGEGETLLKDFDSEVMNLKTFQNQIKQYANEILGKYKK